eukprot:CAMPEP_0114161446 /NCGR_PEP_ID=MMETSP0043_2-20121206/28937_1 /TAXON_ID=464988 /ORGANISM="Hemiselmis andersenii, Strain CCMP644" /LENGTH=66 /DNA_ID=CAMNT_0001257637 /DNA_START=65 /DNA_END=262 /DNA_ORIENTATION=-
MLSKAGQAMLHLTECKDLPKMDIGGLCDAYAVVSDASGRELYRTEICKKTLHAYWHEKMVVDGELL